MTQPLTSAELLAKMKQGPTHPPGKCWSNIAKLGEKPRWIMIDSPWNKDTAQ